MKTNKISNLKLVKEYKNIIIPMLKLSFPRLTTEQIDLVVNNAIENSIKDNKVSLDNNYKNKKIETSLIQMAEYILQKDPIITSYGVLYRNQKEVKNPLSVLIQTFLQSRGIYKKEMYKYPKGSELFEKYNLLQLLAKIDANSLYGALGMYSCIYYNLYVAASITSQGQSAISTSAMAFESFLANNVKFRSLDEVITYIYNILNEERGYSDNLILDSNIDITDCFEYIVDTCGHGYEPTEDDLEIVWNLLLQVSQTDINRLFYKNNLFAFMNNSSMQKAIVYILQKLETPYLNPNSPPDEIKVELESLWDLIKEYVFYNYNIIDSIERLKFLPRATTILIDTDSNLVNLEPWYRFVLDKTYDIPMKIKTQSIDIVSIIEADEFGDRDPIYPIEFVDIELDYDFYTDEVIELERSITPIKILPQDNLRYSIINIMAFILDKVINESMIRYTKGCNSYLDDKKCLLIMKNEYLFKRVLLTEAKKNYASIIELQEGNYVDGVLDIKGLSIAKSTLNEKSQKIMQNILAEDILRAENINQIEILKKVVLLEKDIISSLRSGNKEYYKPLSIKAMSSYDNPMSISGIKASVVWNAVKEPNIEGIDLDKRNYIDILKVDINHKNIEPLKDTNPSVYEKILELFKDNAFKAGITSIAIPSDVQLPEWLKDYINYKVIINDNITNFSKPLESIGLQMISNSINYTNILQI